MSAIPWFADLQELSTGELCFLGFMVFIACFLAGFIMHAILRDSGLGPALNGVLALIGACAGIYLRYRLLAPNSGDDLILTIGFALGTALMLFLTLALIKARMF